ncbi:MAG: EamA-like transporter family [Rhodobacteraceae bacterium HLUCCA12]|nr:MAG: EamA-like transporter family [Rhodobacteraceae bacterium HLUCCA12]
MIRAALPYLALLAIGGAWGMTTPLVKTATQAGHGALGIALWHGVMNIAVLSMVLAVTGRLRRLPLDRASLRLYTVVGLLGIALPQWASYSATTHLPAGITAIVVSLVPVFSLPLALTLGTERFSTRRLAGVALGALAIVMLVAPGASLPAPDLWVWVLVAVLAPLFYAFEGAFVARSPARAANPIQVIWSGSVVAVLALVPLVVAFGGLRAPLPGFGLAEAGIVLAGVLSMAAFAGYVALLRHAGAVFGAQVAYTVTGSGVIWAMVLLGERYSVWVWGALATLFLGLFLVQPRRADAAVEVRDVRP